MKYKAALFDLDGVIIDSEPLHMAAFKSTLSAHGYQLSDTDYTEYFEGRSDEDGFRLYFSSMNKSVDLSSFMADKADAYLAISAHQLIPYHGIQPLIKDLSAHIPVALVTGSLRSEAETALDICGVRACFKTIVAADDVSNGKPDPEGYFKAASAVGVNPSECVVIEDSPSGVHAAKTAGMHCIAVTTTHLPSQLAQADQVVDRLDISLFQ
ncbi:MAG TPA: HAD family phosphatase [Candidatus Saccharimonadales bacterium]|jgi:HAD superfamily hydrolase (TIGR01509 family)